MSTNKKFLPACDAWVLRQGARWFLQKKEGGKWVKDYANLNRIKDIAERHAEAMRLLKLRNGADAPSETSELSAFAQEWLRVKKSDRKNTNASRATCARAWEREMRKAGHTYSTVDEAFARWYNQAYNPSYSVAARTLINRAIKQGVRTAPTPFADVDIISDPEPATLVPVELQPELLNRLRDRDYKVYVMCRIQYYTFIRPEEQVRLSLSDINLSERYIRIPGAKSKGKTTERVVIPEQLAPVLVEWLANKKHFLFEKTDGSHYKSHGIFRKHHQEIVAEMDTLPAGVELYSWKHCGVVAAVKAGIPLRELQMQLRHKSLDQMLAYLRQMGLQDMTSVMKGW